MAYEAVTWTRKTPWRQGHVLPVDAVKELGLVHPIGLESTCVVVVSHACDLVNDSLQLEPNVEVIVGCVLNRPIDGNFSWAKSPRTLHIELTRDGEVVPIELVATFKSLVSKETLAAFVPDTAWSMSGQSLSTLRSWLAVRYNRVAFPDPFVDRLSDSKVKNGLAKLIAPIHKNLSAVYFDVDNGQELDHSDGSAYDLKVVLVYPPGEDPEEAANEIDDLVANVEELFAKRLYDKEAERWNGVHLKSCMAISEDDLPVSRTKLLNEWRYEHMTLKDEGNE